MLLDELSLTTEHEFDGAFFAPASTDILYGLIGQYRGMRAHIEQIASMVRDDTAGAIGYFLEGNGPESGRHAMPSVERLFRVDGAVAALNSAYWSRALALTDVLNCMPEQRRQEWHEQIRAHKAPDFEESTVRDTLATLLNSRARFLAERVDGIFRNLSGEHVTNNPMGFGKRMIIYYANSSYGGRQGHIADLRAVIAKLTGRDEPRWQATHGLLKVLERNTGEWHDVDGGALRIRLYKKGTAHLEVHPDMAWRLNQILAYLYPTAIPSQFRTPSKKKPKDIKLMQKPLPFAVIELLADMSETTERSNPEGYPERYHRIANTLQFRYARSADKFALAEAGRVLEAIGGVPMLHGSYYLFDYDPRKVVDEIVASGCIPDHKSHQFYPTPAELAAKAIELAGIGPKDTVLEPSAGQGSLADLLPRERTTCVEISKLHCDILSAKGHAVVQSDFLAWAPGQPLVDRVVMNPPFSDGRWQAHLQTAAAMVKRGGRLVAILPSGARSKDVLPGWVCEWSPVYNNAFSGASVSVVILTARAPA